MFRRLTAMRAFRFFYYQTLPKTEMIILTIRLLSSAFKYIFTGLPQTGYKVEKS